MAIVILIITVTATTITLTMSMTQVIITPMTATIMVPTVVVLKIAPEKQVSPTVGQLYTTGMSTSSVSPDSNHKHVNNINNNDNTKTHLLHVNMNMMKMNSGQNLNGNSSDDGTISGRSGGSGRNALNTTNNVLINTNLTTKLPRTSQILGKKRKIQDIMTTYEAQAPRKRIHTILNTSSMGAVE